MCEPVIGMSMWHEPMSGLCTNQGRVDDGDGVLFTCSGTMDPNATTVFDDMS
jgi:hypothetical protein